MHPPSEQSIGRQMRGCSMPSVCASPLLHCLSCPLSQSSPASKGRSKESTVISVALRLSFFLRASHDIFLLRSPASGLVDLVSRPIPCQLPYCRPFLCMWFLYGTHFSVSTGPSVSIGPVTDAGNDRPKTKVLLFWLSTRPRLGIIPQWRR